MRKGQQPPWIVPDELWARIKPLLPVVPRRADHPGQSVALLHWFRRLRIRWEIRDDIHEAFLSLACAIICWRRLRNLSPD